MGLRSLPAAVLTAVLTAVMVAVLVPVLPTGTSTAAAASCTPARFTTSAPDGRWSTGGLWVDNNVWNGRGYAVRQRLRACAVGRWSVSVRVGRPRNTWSVKSYPNVHRDWYDWSTGEAGPPLSHFQVIRAAFRTRAPARGIHNTAFDIWVDGVPGVSGVREVMIWTEQHGMRPMGHVIRRGLRIGGRSWTVWATADSSYLAFVPRRDFRRGSVRVLAHLRWLTRHGRLPADVTLGQVGFGFEIIATAHRRQRFTLDRFSLVAR